MKNKIVFVYLKTGGGHQAPARALSSYLEKEKHYNIETILVDGLAGSSKFARFVIEDGYRILQNKAKWLYEVIYFFHKIKIIAMFSNYLVTKNILPYFDKIIAVERPNAIVILHFFMIQPVYKLVEKYKINANVITVVTDPFTAHPLWFVRKDSQFILFSEELKRKCITYGIANNNIKVFPFVLNNKFSVPLEMSLVNKKKEELGLKNRKVILLLGGADGIQNGNNIINAILKLSLDYEIVIVCGKNKQLYKKMIAFKSKNQLTSLTIFGFTNLVYELINISDIVITKCGASTIYEILLSNKIPVINRYIWEQEKGNVEYVVKNKLGVYQKGIKGLALVVNNILSSDTYSQKYINNISSLNLRNGLEEVGEFIASL